MTEAQHMSHAAIPDGEVDEIRKRHKRDAQGSRLRMDEWITELQVDRATLLARLTALEAEKAHAQRLVAEWRKSIELTETALRKSDAECDEWRRRVHEMERAHCRLEEREHKTVRDLKAENAALKAKVADKDGQLAELKTIISAMKQMALQCAHPEGSKAAAMIALASQGEQER